MIIKQNTNIEDVAAIVGFGATLRLIQWYGGGNLYVPGEPIPDHPLIGLIGPAALRALCAEFGGQSIWIPREATRPDIEVKKSVAKLVLKGWGSMAIGLKLKISQRQVQRVRRELEDEGLLPKILRGKVP